MDIRIISSPRTDRILVVSGYMQVILDQGRSADRLIAHSLGPYNEETPMD